MAGLPPLAGYVAKEAALEAFLPGSHGTTWPLPAVAAGAALTVAYTARFLRGAFGSRAAEGTGRHTDRPAPGFVAPATALAAAGLALGIGCAGLGAVAQVYADELPEYRPHPYELALWHGWTPALGLSALTLAAGLALYAALTVHRGPAPPGTPYSDRVHARLRGGLDAAALWFTGRTQVGSLPVYLTGLLLTVAAVVGTAAAVLPQPIGPLHWTSSAVEVPVAAGALAATVAVLRTRHRLTGTLLVGAVGYAVAVLFLSRGAPDLALTQFLVETMTLVVIVLVLRRMPPRFTPARSAWPARIARAVAAGSLGCLVAVLALVTTSAPHPPSVSGGYAALAPETGAGNLVNAIVVDFRALDTLGESAVLLVTAIGVVSLVRVWTRGAPEAPEHAPRLPSPTGTSRPTSGSPARTSGPARNAPSSWRSSPGCCSRPPSCCHCSCCSPATRGQAAGSPAASSRARRSCCATWSAAGPDSARPSPSVRAPSPAPASPSAPPPPSCPSSPGRRRSPA